MTPDEWLALEVGDAIAVNGGPERPVLEVNRVAGKRGQPTGKTRTVIAVPSLKNPGRNIVIFSADDTYGTRVQLIRKQGGKLRMGLAEYIDRLPPAIQAACRLGGWEQAGIWVRLAPSHWSDTDWHYRAYAGMPALVIAYLPNGRLETVTTPQVRIRYMGPVPDECTHEATYGLLALELAM